jgi:hypothetical protein
MIDFVQIINSLMKYQKFNQNKSPNEPEFKDFTN